MTLAPPVTPWAQHGPPCHKLPNFRNHLYQEVHTHGPQGGLPTKSMGISSKRYVKFLGVDYSGGRRMPKMVQNARLKGVVGRMARYQRLGARAARRLIRTGAAPAVRYGARVTGANASAIVAARRASCAAMGSMKGRSSFARLQLADFDVGAVMAVDPILAWAKAVCRWHDHCL